MINDKVELNFEIILRKNKRKVNIENIMLAHAKEKGYIYGGMIQEN